MKITNQNSDNSFEASADKSILDYALENNFNYPYGCTNGFCGKCKALILDGEVAYLKAKPQGLSDEDENDGYALLCQCFPKTNIILAVDELAPEIKVIKTTAKIIELTKLNHDIIKVVLITQTPLQFLSGQYIDIRYQGFDYSSFSIANKVGSNQLEFHIRLIPNGKFTNFIFNKLKVSDIVDIDGPKGDFYLRDGTKNLLLVAGGTGLAPIKAIIEELIAKNDKRLIDFYWGVRDEIDLYTNIAKEWAKNPNINFIPVLSNNDNWSGRSGFVHNAILEDIEDFSNIVVYACGPPIMVESCANSFAKKGLNKNDFFNDIFDFNARK